MAAREAEAVFGLSEAGAHLERALSLWDEVTDASDVAGLDLAGLCSWIAALASKTGAAPRAVVLTERAIALTEESSASLPGLHVRLARYLHESGRTGAGLAELERAVELVPADPPTRERARALAELGSGLRRAWRFSESLEVSEAALALALEVDARDATIRALETLGSDLAYLGRADDGLDHLRQGLELAADSGEPEALLTAYISMTDVLTMLGRPREAARIGKTGLAAMRPYPIDSTVLVSNYIEALTASGAWPEAERVSAESLRSISANFPYMLLMVRADVEVGLGHFDDARSHLDAARATLREDGGLGVYDVYVAELALWEHRWTDADEAAHRGLALAGSTHAAQIRTWLCAKGLRALAELSALARARRDAQAVTAHLGRADTLVQTARDAHGEAAAVTPNATGWLALADAEHARVRDAGTPRRWSDAAATWSELERSPTVAYCRWREAEALIAEGAPRSTAGTRLREAHLIALELGAHPLLHELELLARRSRLDLTVPDLEQPSSRQRLGDVLGLTPREVEVLDLISRGCTNREIASALVISVKTADVHVSHILRKLDTTSRIEAAAIAHRLAPPGQA
jgi:DNA-binding CsgD family transcriptional regulator/tetratricopeptide (TPR) repeat protein